ncbi:TspO/MBR family protein, partial [Terrabacter terrae]|uniref:TspO/MBR family protein n=1 Tax=Terrabacter terrae TaxID=318434 RepID=UPI0031D5A770
VVWTALYADIAASSAAALNAYDEAGDHEGRSTYLKAFGTNLALNTAWSVVFWRSRRPWLAAVHAAVLTASSADLARRAGSANRGAGIALSPYAAWCGFATALSTAIARRNG